DIDLDDVDHGPADNNDIDLDDVHHDDDGAVGLSGDEHRRHGPRLAPGRHRLRQHPPGQ
ncbi:MAG: hypothetical protein JO248_06385, partial [Acidimicrobiia bacterium]|nr:hypothetical protein [Acidimicrobiia bacterium]